MKKMSQHTQGYTLVEMLVAVAVFALAFVTIGAIFIGYNTAQSRAGVSQKLLNEGNHILEAVAREIRMHAIDYNCIFSDICLRAVDGKEIHFRFDHSSAPDKLQVCKDNDGCDIGSSWSTMNPDFLTLGNVEFHTYPLDNPASPSTSAANTYHPITVILMTIESGSGTKQQIFDLQTTVSSRVYDFQ
jgi:prepilin-type N-terminal cleavage/methylation domain-containing protein